MLYRLPPREASFLQLSDCVASFVSLPLSLSQSLSASVAHAHKHRHGRKRTHHSCGCFHSSVPFTPLLPDSSFSGPLTSHLFFILIVRRHTPSLLTPRPLSLRLFFLFLSLTLSCAHKDTHIFATKRLSPLIYVSCTQIISLPQTSSPHLQTFPILCPAFPSSSPVAEDSLCGQGRSRARPLVHHIRHFACLFSPLCSSSNPPPSDCCPSFSGMKKAGTGKVLQHTTFVRFLDTECFCKM